MTRLSLLSVLTLFTVLSACDIGGGTSTDVDIVTGECQGNASGRSVPDADTAGDTGASAEPGVEAEVVDGSLVVHYQDMTANCCPSPGADVTESGDDAITVDLKDVTTDESCDCMCVTNFDVTVPDVSPSLASVTANFNGELVGTVEIAR